MTICTRKVLALLSAAAVFVMIAAGSAVGANITAAFKDAAFREYVYGRIDKTAPAQILDSDVRGITAVSVGNSGISDLSGIEYFTALTSLGVSSNQLTSLDVSKNTALTDLFCNSNQLTELDLSNNTKLKNLYCQFNQLTTLDVSKNTALTYLQCYGNQLTTLDVSKNTSLKTLMCGANEFGGDQLTALDVSGAVALTSLFCHNNQLTALDVSNNTALTVLQCNDNKITALDVSRATALTTLFCHNNQLTTLDVSGATALTQLQCHNNQLTALDVSGATALTTLQCTNNHLATLDVSMNTALTTLMCGANHLTTLDVSNNTALKALICGGQIREGYICEGWYRDAAYTDKWDGYSMSTNLTLYAKWIPAFTITFNATNGTVTLESATTRVDSTLASLPTPTRSDYSFIGWFTAETGGEMVTASKKYSANTIIYAQWTRDATSAFSSDRVIPSVGPVVKSSVAPAVSVSGALSAGPNPARPGGAVSLRWSGSKPVKGTLAVFDAVGGLAGSVDVSGAGKVGEWRTDGVSAGTYLIKGVLTDRDGARVGVSAVVGVR